jgi:hypothetical protein
MVSKASSKHLGIGDVITLNGQIRDQKIRRAVPSDRQNYGAFSIIGRVRLRALAIRQSRNVRRLDNGLGMLAFAS